MDSSKRIRLLEKFLEGFDDKIKTKLRNGKNHLVVAFSELIKSDPELGEDFLENPEEFLETVEVVISSNWEKVKSFYLRVKNLFASQKKRIRDIRSQDIGKFLALEGYVKARSDVRPRITCAKFECPNCGNPLNIFQLESTLNEPAKCGCGRKGKFKLMSKELVDGFTLVLEEPPETIKYGTELKKINVFIKSDLADSQIEDLIFPGVRLRINGTLKDFIKKTSKGAQTTSLDFFLEANYIQFLETTYADIKIAPEEEKEIKKLSKNKNVMDIIINSLFSGIEGHDRIKKAIILQAFGGVTLKDTKVPRRGQIHILLIGDPGSGKSTLLLMCRKFLPKSRYGAGQGASGKGLTASVVRDELLGGFRVEAGMLALSHQGVALIDEMDKIKQEDRYAIHEPLEQGTISIDKADVHVTLKAETSILAAANPHMGRFDPYKDIYAQIDFEPTLINRFDLVFPLKDVINKEQDSATALKILIDEEEEATASVDLIRKYISYAKRIQPKIPPNLAKIIAARYVEIRQSNSGEGSFPITTRQVTAIRRLTEAHARMKLRENPTEEDMNFAIGLIQHNLEQIGTDPATGMVDVDKIQLGITMSERNKFETIMEVIKELENKIGKPVPIEDVVKEATNRKITNVETEQLLDKLRHRGDIFEPRRGFVQTI